MDFKYSALDIARQLRAAGIEMYDPTPEQQAIIESYPLGPSVVVAGAGSGKTETMSARVLWLVANQIVRPDEILGLTFTRKAAGELSHRIRKRLRELRTAGFLPIDASSTQPIDISVSVGTYHSYAGKVLSEHSIRLGIDTDAQPIGEAAAWQIAHSIVTGFTNPDHRLLHGADGIVERVMDLSAQMAEHGATAHEIRSFSAELLEKFAGLSGRSNQDVFKAVDIVKERLAILPMVESFDRYRVEQGQLTFNDQMAFAAELVNKFPDIAELERGKYKVVLLDEYQDTSYSQVRFLAGLFGNGHGVTAVGDPNQAIYGWRSASSETLVAFAKQFVGTSGKECKSYKLMTTWRNDAAILDLANRAIDEIAAHSGRQAKVDRLSLRQGAGPGELISRHYETLITEASGIAEIFYERWNAPERLAITETKRSSFAVLVRNRKNIVAIEQALRDRGLPVEVVGIGGLIHVPEVADIIALLRALTFPEAASSLMRLLAGPRLALGTADLAALGRFTNRIFSANQKSRTMIGMIESGDVATLEADDFAIGSPIETLEYFELISPAKLSDPKQSATFTLGEKSFTIPRSDFTPAGFTRLVHFAHELRALRRSTSHSLTDAILEAERFLALDTEVLVRDGWQNGRTHLDAFMEEAAKFQRTGGTLSSFLAWLEVAAKKEGGLKPISIDVSRTAIQILTVHASKGSEWDVVAVPGLIKNNFPSKKKGSDLWTENSGALPITFRGDRDQLQDFAIPAGSSKGTGGPIYSDTKKALDAQSEYWEDRRIEEEYRLAYVAFTRAKKTLITTASWFGNGEKSLDPSPLFHWAYESSLKQAERAGQSVVAEDFDTNKPDYNNPESENPPTALWPVTSPRIEKIRRSAELVTAARPLDLGKASEELSNSNESEDGFKSQLISDAQSLIIEARSSQSGICVTMPPRLSVSTLITLKEDPDNLALSLRRPLPRHTDSIARRGTTFHEWVEERYKAPKFFDDELGSQYEFELDGSQFDREFRPIDLDLAALQAKWSASQWANRTPVDIEVGFETMLGGRGGLLIRGRIDAVYPRLDAYGKEDGGFEVIDWKTGKVKSGEDLETAAIQLAMYRLAYAKLKKIPVSQISAAFYYVQSGNTVAPANLLGEAELIALITKFPVQL